MGEEEAVVVPDWDTVNEGDILITNIRNGSGPLAVRVEGGRLYPCHYPVQEEDMLREALPFGSPVTAKYPLQTGVWRKVYDGPSGWRRD